MWPQAATQRWLPRAGCFVLAPWLRRSRWVGAARGVPGRVPAGAAEPARPRGPPCAFLQHRAALWREPRRPQPPGTPFPPGSTANRGASRSHHAGGPPERSECRSSGLTELRSSRRRADLRVGPGARTRSGRVRAAGARSSREEGLGEAVVLEPSPHLQAHSSAECSHLRKSIKRSE